MGCTSRSAAVVGGLCKRGRCALISQHQQLPIHLSRPRVTARRQCMQDNTRFGTGPQGSCRSLLDLRQVYAYAGCARRRGFAACGTRCGLVVLVGAQLELTLAEVTHVEPPTTNESAD